MYKYIECCKFISKQCLSILVCILLHQWWWNVKKQNDRGINICYSVIVDKHISSNCCNANKSNSRKRKQKEWPTLQGSQTWVTFGPDWHQKRPIWDFLRSVFWFSVHFGSLVPIWCQYRPILAKIWHPCYINDMILLPP